jgi:hypothetical protein
MVYTFFPVFVDIILLLVVYRQSTDKKPVNSLSKTNIIKNILLITPEFDPDGSVIKILSKYFQIAITLFVKISPIRSSDEHRFFNVRLGYLLTFNVKLDRDK